MLLRRVPCLVQVRISVIVPLKALIIVVPVQAIMKPSCYYVWFLLARLTTNLVLNIIQCQNSLFLDKFFHFSALLP